MATEQNGAKVSGLGSPDEHTGTETDPTLALSGTDTDGEALPGETETPNLGGVCRPSSPNCGPDT
jgi:hypothetical protein